uniref:Uncharacterized protein n=1 Tax=viral metagenome TaxID=1070528 RepID=A0A6M3JJ95_9ZZZZ
MEYPVTTNKLLPVTKPVTSVYYIYTHSCYCNMLRNMLLGTKTASNMLFCYRDNLVILGTKTASNMLPLFGAVKGIKSGVIPAIIYREKQVKEGEVDARNLI